MDLTRCGLRRRSFASRLFRLQATTPLLQVNQQKEEILHHFQSQLHNVQQEINAYNGRLPEVIGQRYQERQQQALKEQRFIEGLEVPVQGEKEK